MRLIDADALIAELHITYLYNSNARGAIYRKIQEQPTIEPKRKTGKWIIHDEIKNIYGGTYIECSECGEKYVVQHMEDEKFCRNCGADMKEGDAE